MVKVAFFTGLLVSCQAKNSLLINDDYIVVNDTIKVVSIDKFKNRIQVHEVSSQYEPLSVITSGKIQAIPTLFAYIATPFSGRVIHNHMKLGDKVSKGTILFEVISPEFTTLQKEYFQAEAQREFAKQDLARKKELLKNGVTSTKEYEEAVTVMRQAEKEYENTQAILKLHQVDINKLTLGDPLVIHSPITGTIIENSIVTGQYIQGDMESIGLVANLDRVWISAQVKEKDIRQISVGDDMHIKVDAFPEEVIKGKVHYIEDLVDNETRSIRVISECHNTNDNLKLGMYATVEFYGKPQKFAVIPEKAILQSEKFSYVLAHVAPNSYLKRQVKVCFTKDGKAYVSDGIAENDKLICEGGYYFQ